MRKTALFTAVFLTAVAFAQAPAPPKTPLDQDTLIPAEHMQDLLRNAPISKETGKPGSLSSQLFGTSKFNTAFIRINEPDKPHAHAGTSEVLVIQGGAGSLETGGEMVGPYQASSDVHTAFFVNGPRTTEATQTAGEPGGPHNGAGTAITGGRTQKVKTGDVILIPAGVPHHWTAIDQPIVYLDVKFPKTE
jgi:mannose-6-phosphate isomerase-like protein (cupin superfamily)